MIKSHHKTIQFPFHKIEMIVSGITGGILLLLIFSRVSNIAVQNPTAVTQSWLGDRDCHDAQWEAFRSNFFLMLTIALVWKYVGSKTHPSILGLGLIILMFRGNVVLYLGVICLSYWFSVSFYKNPRFQIMKWVFVVSTIGIVEYFNRLRPFSAWMSEQIPIDALKNSSHLVEWASILNMSLLKMLSFGVDIHRCYYNKEDLQKHNDKCQLCLVRAPCLKARDMFPSPPPTFMNYINYILFPGTLLAGPPISYNNFHSFKTVPMNSPSPILRFALNFLSFQIFQIYFPVMKLSQKMSILQLSIAIVCSLMFIWYKFNIIWKWAMVWSYLQGVEVIDNMNRCVANNYGFEGFWRMWHRGFNMWLVRYMYIPLGGNKSMVKSYLLVFLFVAFWHDPQLKLLAWAGIILLFILPEVIVKKIVRQKYNHLYKQFWFKYLSAFAGAFYIYSMCVANVIGFGWGFEGFYVLYHKIIEEWVLYIVALLVLTIVVNLMFFFRFLEKEECGY